MILLYARVCRVFILKAPGSSPMGPMNVRQKGGLLLAGHLPVLPHPESLAAQAAYAEALLPPCPGLERLGRSCPARFRVLD